MVEYLAGNRLRGTSAERDNVTSWNISGTTKIQTEGATHSVTSSSAFTWSFWWNPDTINSSCDGSSNCFFIDKLQSQSGEYAPRSYQTSSGALKVTSVSSGVGYGSSVTTSNTMTAGEWNHIIIKQSSGTISAVLNNGTAVSVSTISGTDSAEDFRFFSPNAYMVGKLANIIMYDSELSSTDITKLYNSGVPITSSGAGVTTGVLIENNFTGGSPQTNTGSLGGTTTVYSGSTTLHNGNTALISDGAVYYETDTNKSYVLYDSTWSEL